MTKPWILNVNSNTLNRLNVLPIPASPSSGGSVSSLGMVVSRVLAEDGEGCYSSDLARLWKPPPHSQVPGWELASVMVPHCRHSYVDGEAGSFSPSTSCPWGIYQLVASTININRKKNIRMVNHRLRTELWRLGGPASPTSLGSSPYALSNDWLFPVRHSRVLRTNEETVYALDVENGDLHYRSHHPFSWVLTGWHVWVMIYPSPLCETDWRVGPQVCWTSS